MNIPRYYGRIYDGGTFVGCCNYNTLEECVKFAEADAFADKLIVQDLETNKKTTIKITRQEV